MNNRPHDLGSGPLGEITGAIYWYLIIGVLFVLTTAPGTVAMLFLERHISNAPLYALCLLPVGPAFSALLYAIARRGEAESMVPARFFFRGYRLNALDVLWLWLPASIAVVILAVNLAHWELSGMGSWYPGLAGIFIAVVLVWLLLAVTIASLFDFRTWDTARLAFSFLLRRPMVSLGVLGVLVICALVVLITFDAVLVLLAGLVAKLVLGVTRPAREDIEAEFIQR